MTISPNSSYTSYGYNYFLNKWQTYYQTNFRTFWEELNNVKNNLTKLEQDNIDNFINTILFKLTLPSHPYLIKKNYLYNSKELQQINKEVYTLKEELELKQKYNLPKYFLIQTSVFRYHNGLKFLPPAITATLKNKTILDCGAYFGDSSLIFNKYSPAKIYSFEPCYINYQHLTNTIKNNSLNEIIIPINKGVYDRNGNFILQFNSLINPNLGAKIENNPTKKKHTEIINVTTLDDFINQNNLQDIALIKIDIEGIELEALIGAKNILKYYKPILLIAIYHNAEEFLYVKPFLESLDLNYKFLMMPLDNLDILKEYYLIAY